MLHRERKIAVTVPLHRKDLKRGLLLGIIKDAGFDIEEFRKLL
jgi:predicted RNA binding protein YcfA (HicA-like mRNA interferase family)